MSEQDADAVCGTVKFSYVMCDACDHMACIGHSYEPRKVLVMLGVGHLVNGDGLSICEEK